jgi:hypothetical protein
VDKIRILAALIVLWVWTILVASIAQNPNGMVYRNLSPYIWLWQGVPVEATYTPTPIQSVQHLQCTGNGTVNFTAIDLNYSVISTLGGGAQNGSGNLSNQAIRAVFNSASQAGCGSATGSSVIDFDVIYFVPTLLKHAVVRDLAVTIGTGVNVNGVSSTGYTVTLAKSIAFFQGCTINNGQSINEVNFTARQNSTTQITVYKNNSDNGFDCNVGMVEFK